MGKKKEKREREREESCPWPRKAWKEKEKQKRKKKRQTICPLSKKTRFSQQQQQQKRKKERKKKIGNRQQHIQVHQVKRKCGSSVIDYNYFFPQIGEIQFWWARG